MTAKSIHLNKLLKFYAFEEKRLISALRGELRTERDKFLGAEKGGGDFHSPFWADAKLHVIGAVQLRASTNARVAALKQRSRLYPALADGFLSWFDGLRRSTNERIGLKDGRVHSHVQFDHLELELKVDSVLAISTGAEKYRLIYPYFSEEPILNAKWARVGLWAMAAALTEYDPVDMHILDVLRGASFGGDRVALRGDEQHLFEERYRAVLLLWDELRPEYGL